MELWCSDYNLGVYLVNMHFRLFDYPATARTIFLRFAGRLADLSPRNMSVVSFALPSFFSFAFM
jgi:hypothetical protein